MRKKEGESVVSRMYPGHSSERTVLLSRSATPSSRGSSRTDSGVRSTDSGVRQQTQTQLCTHQQWGQQHPHLSGSVCPVCTTVITAVPTARSFQ